MKDFSFWEKYEGASEGSGRSEKIWLINPDTNQTGLFKFKKDVGTTDHVSECIAQDLSDLLEIPCARFELGTYKGREGSMSYNIAESSGSVLIEGIYCINLAYKNYDAEKLFDGETGDRYSLEMIEKALSGLNLFDSFLPILVFDFLIGNTDRHQSNWALLMKDEKFEISPLYDNSSSLCAYIKEDMIKKYLGHDLLLWKSLVDTKSKSLIRISCKDKKQPTHLGMLKVLHEKYFQQTRKTADKIKMRITENSICEILNKYNEGLSESRKILIKKYLLSKVELIKNIYTESEVSYV